MHFSEALAFVCAEHFLQIHPALFAITKPIEITMTNKKLQSQHTSWMAAKTHWFTLIKHNQKTIVYCHKNNMMYYGSPAVQLHSHMPDGHAFLAQTCMDNDQFPRLLILDVVTPRLVNPVERGALLRSLAGFFPSTCTIQWVGESDALRKFLRNGLPHPVECVIELGEPLHITKEFSLCL